MLKNIFITICAIAVSFVSLEAAMRICGYHGLDIDFQPYIYSKDYGWEHKKNYFHRWESLEWNIDYQTNSSGFRDLERDLKKKEGVTRIIIIGDSQADGQGVSREDMWQSILAKKLGDRYEIVNLGVMGYDIIQEYRQFINIGLDYKPDIVLQVLEPNDWGRVSHTVSGRMKLYKPGYKIMDGEIEFLSSPDKPDCLIPDLVWLDKLKSLIYRSAAITWIKTRLSQFKIIRNIKLLTALNRPSKEKHMSAAEEYYDTNYPEAADVIYKKFALLEKERKFKMMVIYIDYIGNAIPEELESVIKANIGNPICIRLSKKEMWKFDPHPNGKGNAVIADRVFELLTAYSNARSSAIAH